MAAIVGVVVAACGGGSDRTELVDAVVDRYLLNRGCAKEAIGKLSSSDADAFAEQFDGGPSDVDISAAGHRVFLHMLTECAE